MKEIELLNSRLVIKVFLRIVRTKRLLFNSSGKNERLLFWYCSFDVSGDFDKC